MFCRDDVLLGLQTCCSAAKEIVRTCLYYSSLIQNQLKILQKENGGGGKKLSKPNTRMNKWVTTENHRSWLWRPLPITLAFLSISTATATAGAPGLAGSGVPSLCGHLQTILAFPSGGALTITRANVLHWFSCWWPFPSIYCFLELRIQWNMLDLVQAHSQSTECVFCVLGMW